MDDEETLRREAKKLNATLENEGEQCELKRWWISRNWPESRPVADDTLECISESFLRDEDELQQSLVRDVVKRSLEKLYGEDLDEQGAEDGELKQGTDSDLLKALPGKIGSLRYSVVLSMFAVLSKRGETSHSRSFAEREVIQILSKRTQEESLPDDVKDVLRIFRSALEGRKPAGRSRFSEEAQKAVQIFSKEPESCFEAAELSLENLQSLPIRCLHAMLDILNCNHRDIKELYHFKYGGNRQRLSASIRKETLKLLNKVREDDDSRLPQRLQRALRVMSLQAMELKGNDEGLSKYLDELPPETESMYNRLLIALKELYKLSFADLEAVYVKISTSEERIVCKNHPRVYLETVKSMLEEALFRCTVEDVPESIEQAVQMIFHARPAYVSACKKRDASRMLQHLEGETEAVLNLSSHLQQLSWEWIESRALVQDEQQPSPQLKKQKVEDAGETSGPVKPEVAEQVKVEYPEVMVDFEDDLEEANKEVTSVADEGASLAYVILGRAMAEMFRGKSGPDMNYLRTGLDPYEDDEVERVQDHGSPGQKPDQEVRLLLKIVERIPSISERVLQNVKRRLS